MSEVIPAAGSRPVRPWMHGLAVVGAAVLFGTTGTAQDLGPSGTTPLGVGTLRIVIGAVALWCFARCLPRWSTTQGHRLAIVAGGLGVAVYQPAFFTGTARLGVALGTVIALGSGPLFAGLIEWWRLGRRPGGWWLLATAVTVLGGGLLVVIGRTAGADTAGADTAAIELARLDVTGLDVTGLLGAFGAGLGYAVYALAAKVSIDRGMHSTVALAWPFTLGAAILAATLVVVPQPLDWVASWSGAVMLVHLGVFTVGLAYVLYGWGLRAVPGSSAVTLTLAEPLTATIAAVVLLEERLRPGGWLGAGLVVVGLFLAGWAAGRSSRTMASVRV